jgi:hypothetical protein
MTENVSTITVLAKKARTITHRTRKQIGDAEKILSDARHALHRSETKA